MEKIYNVMNTNNVVNYDYNNAKYFILSIAWRYLMYEFEQNNNKANSILLPPESWRLPLLQKNTTEIDKYSMYIIPYE